MSDLLELSDIHMHFPLPNRRVLGALNGVNLTVAKGEVLGIVGESGCGKTTLARVMMGIYKPTSGELRFDGQRVNLRTAKDRRAYAQKMQMVFQDPFSSLNPRLKVAQIIGEGLIIQGVRDQEVLSNRVAELLQMVGLHPDFAGRYPHAFSGGQRQRIGIARALATNPIFLVCDEPISALDISVQAQVVNLLQDLHQQMDLTMVFIAHDLNMVRYLCNRIAVLYLGHLVELAPTEALSHRPLHPYSQLLLESVLTPNPDDNRLQAPADSYELSSPILPIIGCPFAARCPKCKAVCRTQAPLLQEQSAGHWVACHFNHT